MTVVEYNSEFYTDFIALYPQFAGQDEKQVQLMFGLAVEILPNTPQSVVPHDPDMGIMTRRIAYMALICHLLTLRSRGDVAGAVTSASEGSVSASFSPLTSRGQGAEWFNQTACGAMFWQIVRRYRRSLVYVDANG